MRDSNPTPPFRLLILLSPPLIVMAVIFYLSSQPSTADYPAWEVLVRKLGHVSGYALLFFTWWRAFRGLLSSSGRLITVLAAVAVSLAYAMSDELHQTFVSGRHGTPVDVLIDSLGTTAAALLAVGTRARQATPARRSRRGHGFGRVRPDGFRLAHLTNPQPADEGGQAPVGRGRAIA
jgi:VanZ family protein